MIPSLTLDNQNTKDIFDTMLARMPQYYSKPLETTYQDPGVALLELFCLLKDMQQYYLDYVDEAHKQAYARLMGLAPTAPAPAKTLLQCDGTGVLPKGLLAYAGDIPFETVDTLTLSQNRLVEMLTFADGQLTPLARTDCFPFGRPANVGNALYVGFEQDLHHVPMYSLSIDIVPSSSLVRQPCAPVSLSYFSVEGAWVDCPFTDTTHGFTQSGTVSFALPSPQQALSLLGKPPLFWVRISLNDCDMAQAPHLTNLLMNAVPAVQQQTFVTHELLTVTPENTVLFNTFLAQTGRMTVFEPWESDFRPISKQAFRVEDCLHFNQDRRGTQVLLVSWRADITNELTATNGTPRQAIPCPPHGVVSALLIGTQTPQGRRYTRWTAVADFARSGPLDKHFLQEGECLRFGNDEHGAVPPEGRVLLLDCVQTLGSGGNVQARRIHRAVMPHVTVSNPRAATGGQDAAPAVARPTTTVPRRCVTLDDYAKLLLSRFPIDSVLPVMQDNIIVLHVCPTSDRPLPTLGKALASDILQCLEPARLITTAVRLSSPMYLAITVYAQLVVDAASMSHEATVLTQLHKVVPTASHAKMFAATLSHGDLYGLVSSLPFVRRVSALWFLCDGRKVSAGILTLAAGSIPYLASAELSFTRDTI